MKVEMNVMSTYLDRLLKMAIGAAGRDSCARSLHGNTNDAGQPRKGNAE
jgi:hypothetical protein